MYKTLKKAVVVVALLVISGGILLNINNLFFKVNGEPKKLKDQEVIMLNKSRKKMDLVMADQENINIGDHYLSLYEENPSGDIYTEEVIVSRVGDKIEIKDNVLYNNGTAIYRFNDLGEEAKKKLIVDNKTAIENTKNKKGKNDPNHVNVLTVDKNGYQIIPRYNNGGWDTEGSLLYVEDK